MLINDLLDFSKIEAGQLSIENLEFDLTDLLESVGEVMGLRAHQKGIELACHTQSNAPGKVEGDPNRIRQILLNLVGNAIKFTSQGEVVLSVKWRPENTNHGTLTFCISDTGMGIPPDKIGRLFESFTQADSSIARKFGGTGLGLAISKRLVELMGGKIWLVSKLGEGTQFLFTTPTRAIASVPAALPEYSMQTLQGCRTLVVDDTQVNRLILREFLTECGAIVHEAESGRAALQELLRAQKNGSTYDLVLMDVRMPDIDGFKVAEELKKLPSLSSSIVMMITSDDRGGDLAKTKSLDLNGYLVKPVRKAELLKVLASALAGHKVYQPAGTGYQPTLEVLPVPAAKILLVDDYENNRSLIINYLKKTDCQIEIAEDGKKAVAKAKSKSFDLILMDMEMPVLDGFQATALIREWEVQEKKTPTPIIALSANALLEDKRRSLEVGCNAYLTKPIKKAVLLQAIIDFALHHD